MFVPEDPIGNKAALVQIMIWHQTMTSHYLNQLWQSLLTHIYFDQPKWVKTLPVFCNKDTVRTCITKPFLNLENQVIHSYGHQVLSVIFTALRAFFYIINYIHYLTHWGQVTYICISKSTIIVSDNGLSPGRCQAIIWTNAWMHNSLGPQEQTSVKSKSKFLQFH